ncbi:hypothetical protein BN2497_10499 [Janthinobacterium sp. CG23_2]|nr:hypothetical protein BN2497_37 [Janthinobacterium sp. CG23_2]CUI03892.1 hypothetical protein BN2497_2561 [Janthinobacterium sp. CG23_2]CUI07861.1 hypothetical protein BN2497_10499 [Janthinobacterium sp. CG23_2]CUU26416.1 hypothetical protein BN3177_37 [Janthinobacterium sp. CG23_2]CUU27678.1 hypothetical protein BN3177_2561 [Janthinobacterium sp. CG23_2]
MSARPTITLQWGGKADPVPDAGYVLAGPTVPAPTGTEPAPAYADREIGLRLENWSRWVNSSEGGGGAACVTGAICDKLRKEAEGSPPSRQWRHAIDSVDAARIEVGMRALSDFDRLLLDWCYIEMAPPDLIMRKMSIPKTDFVLRVRAAQAAIEELAQQ